MSCSLMETWRLSRKSADWSALVYSIQGQESVKVSPDSSLTGQTQPKLKQIMFQRLVEYIAHVLLRHVIAWRRAPDRRRLIEPPPDPLSRLGPKLSVSSPIGRRLELLTIAMRLEAFVTLSCTHATPTTNAAKTCMLHVSDNVVTSMQDSNGPGRLTTGRPLPWHCISPYD